MFGARVDYVNNGHKSADQQQQPQTVCANNRVWMFACVCVSLQRARDWNVEGVW